MKGDNHFLAVTTTQDEATGETKPLFAFPVQVCKATETATDAGFDIAAPSGGPREQIYRDSITGEVVADAECLKGIRIGDEFRSIDKDAIDEINKATKITMMTALGTIDLDDARARYSDRVTGKYFLQSPTKGGSPTAYRLAYESLLPAKKKGDRPAQKAKAVVTKRTAKSRQKLALIYADEGEGCLVLLEVHFAASMREPDEQVRAHLTAKVEQKQLDTARTVIASLPDGHAAIEAEVDDALALRAELREKAVAGQPIDAPTPVAESSASDDLTAALEASLAAAG